MHHHPEGVLRPIVGEVGALLDHVRDHRAPAMVPMQPEKKSVVVKGLEAGGESWGGAVGWVLPGRNQPPPQWADDALECDCVTGEKKRYSRVKAGCLGILDPVGIEPTTFCLQSRRHTTRP